MKSMRRDQPQRPVDAAAHASTAEAQARRTEVMPVAAGCWTQRADWRAKAHAGNTVYTFFCHVGSWCSNGSSVTDTGVADAVGRPRPQDGAMGVSLPVMLGRLPTRAVPTAGTSSCWAQETAAMHVTLLRSSRYSTALSSDAEHLMASRGRPGVRMVAPMLRRCRQTTSSETAKRAAVL